MSRYIITGKEDLDAAVRTLLTRDAHRGVYPVQPILEYSF